MEKSISWRGNFPLLKTLKKYSDQSINFFTTNFLTLVVIYTCIYIYYIYLYLYMYKFIYMMIMNCFCGMADRRKAFTLISSRDHCQRSSPSRISDTPRAGFEPAQSLNSGLVKWSYAAVITTTPRHHYIMLIYLLYLFIFLYIHI